MPVCSTWRITYDADGDSPLVLVDYGDLLADELEFPISQTNQPRGGLRVRERDSFARGNIVAEFGFGRILEWSSHAAAREWCIDHGDAFRRLALLRPALEVSVQGGKAYRWSTAPWLSVAPAVSLDHKGLIWTRCEYRFDAGPRQLETRSIRVQTTGGIDVVCAPWGPSPGGQGRWSWRAEIDPDVTIDVSFASGAWRVAVDDLDPGGTSTALWIYDDEGSGQPMQPWDTSTVQWVPDPSTTGNVIVTLA